VRRLLAAAYAGYLVALGLLTLTPGQDAPGTAMDGLLDLLRRVGIDPSTGQLEVGANVLLFVPLSLLGWYLFARPGVVGWLVVGVLVSAGIELAQLVIPDRVSTIGDVIANGSGAGLGALVALAQGRLSPVRSTKDVK